ncbi:hypothetical protein GEMRC1_011869 [Eukaryota sp. GEM-RC1]
MSHSCDFLDDFQEDPCRRFPDQFISDSESFVCPICMFVSKESIVTGSCHHFFCRLCIMRWIRQESCCPICRNSLSLSDIHDLSPEQAATVQSLILHCDYEANGCSWQGPLSELLSHLQSCSYALEQGYAPPVLATDPHEFVVGDRVFIKVTCRDRLGNVVPGDSGMVVGITDSDNGQREAICNFPSESNYKINFDNLLLSLPKLQPFDLCRIRSVVVDLMGGWRNLTSEAIGVVRSSKYGSKSLEFLILLLSLLIFGSEIGVHKLDSRQLVLVPRRFEVQDRVKVREDCPSPLYRWGRASRTEEGSVIEVQRRDAGDSLYIDFPSHKRWHGISYDMQLLPPLVSLRDKVHIRPDIVAPLFPIPSSIGTKTTGTVVELNPNGESAVVKFNLESDSDSMQSEVNVTIALADMMSATAVYNIGDLVRVKHGLESVRYGWGNISQSEVGVVVKRDSMELRVDFPSQRNWHAWAPDMELATSALRVGNVVVISETFRDDDVLLNSLHVILLVELLKLTMMTFSLIGTTVLPISNFKQGSRVQLSLECVNPTYGYGRVRRSEVGVVKSLVDNGEVLIDFPNHPEFRGTVYELELAPHAFRVGDKVRVKASVTEPKYKFGNVSHGDVGIVRRVDGNFLRIDFDNHRNWAGYAPDLELAESDGTRAQIITVGSEVKLNPAADFPFGSPPVTDEIGKVIDVSMDSCTVDFPSVPHFLLHAEDVLLVGVERSVEPMVADSRPSVSGFHVGQRVRVKDGITSPKFRWGSVGKTDVGIIRSIEDDLTALVDFPIQPKWRAYLPEMEVVDVIDKPQPPPP